MYSEPPPKKPSDMKNQHSENAITVENLGKCYQIYKKPRDRLLQMLSFGRKKFHDDFWALKDISFTVNRGETVGIIGRNGSGKSTLLQIICGTLNSSSGAVTVNGKVAALLELGAGFNPEFTGRDNVYMAASLYGLSQEQINARFIDIEKFADIGEHIDQPVKNYSSGMYVRLAFAVIAHVDADILVIDEALAVGDAVFTQKCMRFIRKFKEHGTLLFVSHDMSSVINLCQKAIWLDKGELKSIGKAKEISEGYLQDTLQEIYGEDIQLNHIDFEQEESDSPIETSESEAGSSLIDYQSEYEIHNNLNATNGWKTGHAEITSVDFENLSSATSIFKGGEKVRLSIQARAITPLEKPIIGFLVRDRLGQDLFGENTLPFTEKNSITIEANQTFGAEFEFTLPMLPNGKYVMMTSLADGDLYNNIQHHWLHDAAIINVTSSKVRWGLVGIKFNNVFLRADNENTAQSV